MPTYINLTPHNINFNDGRVFEKSGQVARVKEKYSDFIEDICTVEPEEVTGVPTESTEGTFYIVSAMILNALRNTRADLVAPATGHPGTVRNEQGHIVSVPGFVH